MKTKDLEHAIAKTSSKVSLDKTRIKTNNINPKNINKNKKGINNNHCKNNYQIV